MADLLADPWRWHLPEHREPPAHLRWPEVIEFRQDPATTLAQMAAILAQSNVTSISELLPLVVRYAQSINLAPDLRVELINNVAAVFRAVPGRDAAATGLVLQAQADATAARTIATAAAAMAQANAASTLGTAPIPTVGAHGGDAAAFAPLVWGLPPNPAPSPVMMAPPQRVATPFTAAPGVITPAAVIGNITNPVGFGLPPAPVRQGISAHAPQLTPPTMTAPPGRVAAISTATPGAMPAPAAATCNFAAPAPPPASVSVTALAAALKASSKTNKFTTIDDAFSPNWDLLGAKDRAIYVKCSEASSGWKRFTVGPSTSTILIDFIQDKARPAQVGATFPALAGAGGAPTATLAAQGNVAMAARLAQVGAIAGPNGAPPAPSAAQGNAAMAARYPQDFFAGDPMEALRLAQADEAAANAAAASITGPRRTVAELLADPWRWHMPEHREPPAHLRWPEVIEFRQDLATTLAQMAAILAQSNVTNISELLRLVVRYSQSIHLAPDLHLELINHVAAVFRAVPGRDAADTSLVLLAQADATAARTIATAAAAMAQANAASTLGTAPIPTVGAHGGDAAAFAPLVWGLPPNPAPSPVMMAPPQRVATPFTAAGVMTPGAAVKGVATL